MHYSTRPSKYQPLLEQLHLQTRHLANGISYMYTEPVRIAPLESAFSEDDIDIENWEHLSQHAAYFAKSEAFTIDGTGKVSFAERLPYTQNGKTIILSATMSQICMKQLFPNRKVHWRYVNEIRNKGKVIQDLTYSFSKHDLDNNFEERIDYIKRLVPDYKAYTVITFKGLTDRFLKYGFHIGYSGEGTPYAFGNIDGIDTLNGKPLLIIGKFSLPENIYKLQAMGLGLSIPDEKQNNHKKRIGDYKVNYFSFKDETLWTLQNTAIQSMTVQAAGRARTVRTPAKVWIFNNMPCSIADDVRYMGITIRENNRHEMKR